MVGKVLPRSFSMSAAASAPTDCRKIWETRHSRRKLAGAVVTTCAPLQLLQDSLVPTLLSKAQSTAINGQVLASCPHKDIVPAVLAMLVLTMTVAQHCCLHCSHSPPAAYLHTSVRLQPQFLYAVGMTSTVLCACCGVPHQTHFCPLAE